MPQAAGAAWDGPAPCSIVAHGSSCCVMAVQRAGWRGLGGCCSRLPGTQSSAAASLRWLCCGSRQGGWVIMHANNQLRQQPTSVSSRACVSTPTDSSHIRTVMKMTYMRVHSILTACGHAWHTWGRLGHLPQRHQGVTHPALSLCSRPGRAHVLTPSCPLALPKPLRPSFLWVEDAAGTHREASGYGAARAVSVFRIDLPHASEAYIYLLVQALRRWR